MELDELKKSWKALDQRLQQEPVADERKVEELIRHYKADTGTGLRKLLGVHRFNLWLGGSIAVLCLIGGIVGCLYIEEDTLRNKLMATLTFVLISILFAGAWDYRTYLWIRNTRVDSMSVSQVSLRMTRLRKWIRNEVIGVAIWCLAYTLFDFFLYEGYLASVTRQIAYFALCLVLDVAIIGYFYRRFVYRHLNNIKANIEELKEICCE